DRDCGHRSRKLRYAGATHLKQSVPRRRSPQRRVADRRGQSRIASTGEVRAALSAGKKPPNTPITPPTASAPSKISGVGSNEIVISDQELKFIIEKCTKPIASDASAPTAPPISANSTDSSRND